MANTLNLGTDGNWATKENSLLGYNSESGNYKPLPFDFTRASSATVVNKEGLIETVQSGIPRIDFLGNTNGALLLEPQRTNLFLNSEPTSNEGATAGVSYESFDWAIGFTNCVKYGDNSTIRYRYGATAVSATQYAVSAFVIMDDLSEPVVGGLSNSGDFSFAIGGSLAYSVNPNIYMGNNIWKVSASIPSGGNSGNNGIIKYTTQSNKGFRVVGYQLESGSYATSYIPTSGSAVTRLLDSCSNGGNEQVINSTEGVLYFNAMTKDSASTSKAISISNGSNTILSSYFYGASINVVFNINGVNQFYANFSITIGQEYKIAILYQENNFALYVDGVKRVEETNGSVPSINTFNTLNFAQESSSNFYGNVKDVRVYNTALTDEELQELTTI